MKSEEEWSTRALELLREEGALRVRVGEVLYGLLTFEVRAAMQLGHEMADARAEEIAARFEACDRDCAFKFTNYPGAAAIARAFISKPEPKNREQVLEEALREVLGGGCSCEMYRTVPPMHEHNEHCSVEIARRALEWKPS